MSLNRVSACVFAVAASLAGCMGTGDVEYAGEVRVSSPELIALSSGVYVIADADEPLFYSDGFYWLYRDGYWMRSDDYRGGFVQVNIGYVPERVRMIERPQTYAQYRRHHHGRTMQARATTQPQRTMQPQPQPIYPSQVQPPASQPTNPGQTAPPPSTTYVPTESGLPPEPPGVAPDRAGPEPQRTRVPPADERDRTPPGQARDRVPPGQQDRAAPQPPQPPRAQVRDEPKPQTPQQRGPTARPEDRGPQDVKDKPQDRGNPNQAGDREQERGNRSPIRAEDHPAHKADAEKRDRKADEKQEKKKSDK